ncbi:MAG: cystathionine gamma-lyase [Longimicrobiales bacterium]
MRDATRIVKAGVPSSVPGAPLLPGPTFASVFHLPGDPNDSPYQYGRYGNPTWTHFESALEELEGGPAVVFASGMAAVYAVLQTALNPGDKLVVTDDAYFNARTVAGEQLPQRGIEVEFVEADRVEAALAGARMLWVETPSNPSLNTYDLERLCEAARAQGALVAVDNSTATAAGQTPLGLGADFSVASDTKALTGHSDVVLGHVAVRDPEWAEQLRTWRNHTGAIPGPMEVWLAHRSLGTLDVRLERIGKNAQAVAEYLASRTDLVQVRYPGLPSDPAHEIARKQMKRFGPVVSLELETPEAASEFLKASQLLTEATSFGGLHSTGERRARWGGDAIGEGFLRLSIGCEDAEDLCEDIAQALDRALG